jgi:hypothetical protein
MTFDPCVHTAQRNYGPCGISNLLASWESGSSTSVAPAGRCWAYPTARASGWVSLRRHAGRSHQRVTVGARSYGVSENGSQEPEDTPECQDHVQDGTCGSQYDEGFHWLSLLGRSAGGVGVLPAPETDRHESSRSENPHGSTACSALRTSSCHGNVGSDPEKLDTPPLWS